MKLPKIENIGLIGIIALVILVFSFVILGFQGLMTTFGIMLLFMLPIYLILNNFNLEQDEKLVFSFFIGVGIFPSITYWTGLFISFRIAVFVAFIILIIAAFAVKNLIKNKILL